MLRKPILPLAAALLPLLAGCASGGHHARSGSLLGAVLGAGSGAIIGHQTGDRGAGALIGAGIGAVAGALVGGAVDHAESDAAYRAAVAEERALRAVEAGEASILEVVRMSQAGLSDAVIVAMIDRSGAAYRLSVEDVIDLRRSGVSDAVIEHMLRRSSTSAAAVYSQHVRTVFRPAAVPCCPHHAHRPPRIHVHAGWRWCN